MNNKELEVKISIELNGKCYGHSHKYSKLAASLSDVTKKTLTKEAVDTLIEKMEREGAFKET